MNKRDVVITGLGYVRPMARTIHIVYDSASSWFASGITFHQEVGRLRLRVSNCRETRKILTILKTNPIFTAFTNLKA